jgi:thiosulfate/3-mercaptopyruvate sulfurtransferase
MDGYANDVLVEPAWLEDHLGDDAIRVVEVDEDPSVYTRGHIPGAIGFDWRADLQDPLTRSFLDADRFGALLGSRGIANRHLIVLYGDRNNWFAAYAYWYLKYYGHDAVKLLNGPRERWLAEGRPVTTELPGCPSATYSVTGHDATIRATRDDVLLALSTPCQLVDARTPQEYSGALFAARGYEHEGAQRAGHIPGAKSIPWVLAVNEDGTFKSADELRKLFTAKGVTGGSAIISYCRIGERSAHTWFVLHELLGEPDVRNYDGSWTEWGNLVGAPVEQGYHEEN